MDDSGYKNDLPQPGAVASYPAGGRPCDDRYFPTWLREQLILQFQGVDQASRSEATAQIDAYERRFMAIFGDTSGGGPMRASQSLAAEVPTQRNGDTVGPSDD